MTGGRNQVLRYTRILHRADGVNWRYCARRGSLSHWTTDMGWVAEVARDGDGGPMLDLYHVDSARCQLTGNPEYPLRYHPASGRPQDWRPWDYFRTVSLPNDDETYNGLGYGFTSRALELMRVLVAVMIHDQEEIGARMPKGILFLQNVTEDQWDDALQGRQEDASATERQYFGGVMVIATAGMESPDAKLVALSQLPANFDAEKFLNLSMFGLSLCAGYPADEFWPIQFGSLGRGTESEQAHRKASSKGVTDWTKACQEELQAEIPESLEFDFEYRDLSAELEAATLAQAWANVGKTLYESGETGPDGPLFTRDEVRAVLADYADIIPAEWAVLDQDVEIDDDEKTDRRLRDELRESPRIQRAIELFPSEPIVRYEYPAGRMRVIWRRGDLAMRRSAWPGAQVRRQEPDGGQTAADGVLYSDALVTITEGDVDASIATGAARVGGALREFLEAPTVEE